MTAEFRANDFLLAPDIGAAYGRSHKLRTHERPRAADRSWRPAERGGARARAGREQRAGRGEPGPGRTGRQVRPAAEFRTAWPTLLPENGVAAAALHPCLRYGAQRVDVHRGPARPALAGADTAAQLSRLLPDLRGPVQGQPRHQQLHRLPGYRGFHIRLYRTVDRGRIECDPGEYHAHTRAALPARLPATRLRAGGVSAAAAVHACAVRHRAGNRGAAHV